MTYLTYMSNPVSSQVVVVVDVDSFVCLPEPRQQSVWIVSIEKLVIKVDRKIEVVILKKDNVKK